MEGARHAVGKALALAAVLAVGVVCYRECRPSPTPPPTPPPAAPAVARFGPVTGGVEYRLVGILDWARAAQGMGLHAGDMVRTGPRAAAEIRFLDGAVLQVRPGSLLTLEAGPTDAPRRVLGRLDSGGILYSAQRKNRESPPAWSTTTFDWRDSATAPEPPRVAVDLEPAGGGQIRQYRGSGSMRTPAGDTRDLGPNEGVRVDPQGKAGSKLVLPLPPVLRAPPHQAEITYADPASTTTLLKWDEARSAVAYHVMVDVSGFFEAPLMDRKGVAPTFLELPGLKPGRYYWRVAALGRAGAEGAFSDFARFRVTRGAGPPPLEIDALDVRKNILQVKGRTAPGASLTVNAQKVDVQRDGAFGEFVTLPKGGRQVVVIRATGADGAVKEERRTVEAGRP